MLLLLAASSRRLDIAYTHGCCHLVNFPWNCAPKFGQNSIFERRMLLLHHQMPLLNAQLEENKKERKKENLGAAYSSSHTALEKESRSAFAKKIFGRITNAYFRIIQKYLCHSDLTLGFYLEIVPSECFLNIRNKVSSQTKKNVQKFIRIMCANFALNLFIDKSINIFRFTDPKLLIFQLVPVCFYIPNIYLHYYYGILFQNLF